MYNPLHLGRHVLQENDLRLASLDDFLILDGLVESFAVRALDVLLECLLVIVGLLNVEEVGIILTSVHDESHVARLIANLLGQFTKKLDKSLTLAGNSTHSGIEVDFSSHSGL